MFSGIRYFFTGFTLLLKPGIKRYVVIPLFINISVFSLGLWLGIQWFERFLDRVLPSWLSWAEFLLWPLFAVSYFVIVFYTFALLVNVIAAPFNGLLAEKIEHFLSGEPLQGSKQDTIKLLKELPGMIGNEISKLLYLLLRSLPLLILFLIPGVNLVAPIAWFLFSAWMLCLEYLDYPCGNHSISFKETRVLASKQKIRSLSFGAVTTGFTSIPLINFIVMPVAVAGATAMYLDTFKKPL